MLAAEREDAKEKINDTSLATQTWNKIPTSFHFIDTTS